MSGTLRAPIARPPAPASTAPSEISFPEKHGRLDERHTAAPSDDLVSGVRVSISVHVVGDSLLRSVLLLPSVAVVADS